MSDLVLNSRPFSSLKNFVIDSMEIIEEGEDERIESISYEERDETLAISILSEAAEPDISPSSSLSIVKSRLKVKVRTRRFRIGLQPASGVTSNSVGNSVGGGTCDVA